MNFGQWKLSWEASGVLFQATDTLWTSFDSLDGKIGWIINHWHVEDDCLTQKMMPIGSNPSTMTNRANPMGQTQWFNQHTGNKSYIYLLYWEKLAAIINILQRRYCLWCYWQQSKRRMRILPPSMGVVWSSSLWSWCSRHVEILWCQKICGC